MNCLHALILCVLVFSCNDLLGQKNTTGSESLRLVVQRHSLRPINLITINDATTEEALDSLMLIDGNVKVLDFYSPNLDTITMVYYQHHSRNRRTLWTQFVFDKKTKLYISRTVIIHNYFQPPQAMSGYGVIYGVTGISDDTDYFKNFKLEGHDTINFDQRVELNSTKFANRTYGFYDVEYLKNAGTWLITNK